MRSARRLDVVALLWIAALSTIVLWPDTAPADDKPGPSRRIAIMPLVNLKPDKETDWLGPGTAQTLATNLMRVSGLVLVEPAKLANVLTQRGEKVVASAEANTPAKGAKNAAAERALVGSYTREGPTIVFNVRVLDVETGTVLHAARVQGDWSRTYELMTQLAGAVIDSFDKKVVIVDGRPTAGEAPKAERIVLTEDEAKRLKDWGTTNRDAYEAALRGSGEVDPNNRVFWFSKAIELDPKDSSAYYNRGAAYASRGDNGRAIKDYDKAIELDPKDVLAYLGRGVSYARQSDFNLALKDFDKAIELDPRFDLAYSGRGSVYAKKLDLDRAMKDFDKAIELDPKDSLAYGNRGAAYASKGDIGTAIDDYNKAIEFDAENATFYSLRAFAYYRRLEYDKAWEDVRACQWLGGSVNSRFLTDLRHAMSLRAIDTRTPVATTNPDASDAFTRGNEASEPALKLTYYTKAIQLDPNYALAYQGRGIAYVTKGDFDAAIKDFGKVIELEPNNSAALNNRAFSYVVKREFEKAMQDVEKAILLSPKNPDIYETRAEALCGMANYDKAWEDVKACRKLGGTVPLEFLQKLRKASGRNE